MQMEEQTYGDVHVLSIQQPRIDLRSAGALKQAVSNMVGKNRRRIVVDLSSVTFVDSTGLGALVASLKLVGREGELVVCGLNESVSTLFKLARMDKVFRTFATAPDAVSALASSGA